MNGKMDFIVNVLKNSPAFKSLLKNAKVGKSL